MAYLHVQDKKNVLSSILNSSMLYEVNSVFSTVSWQDYSLRCTMTGHKSTVSCLAVASGVLYSGSWDGTIRSWWLTDHTPLSVLEDDIAGSMAPVLSISTEANFVVSSYENGYFKVHQNSKHESFFLATFHPTNLDIPFSLILIVLFSSNS